MIPSLRDINDFKIFAAVKVDNSYAIITLPKPMSIHYEMSYNRLRKEYIIDWQEDVSKQIYSDRSNFLIIYVYDMFDKKINTEVLHVFSLEYHRGSMSHNQTRITNRYRCAVNFVLTPDEEMVVSILNERLKIKINKLRGNDINTITVDELPNESDNMSDTFLVLRNAARAICVTSIVTMPEIVDIYYNAPYTTVKWFDGTTTTVAATNDEEFNKELGLAMAISRKYCECMGVEYPRAAFKRMVNNANDQTAKTAARKAYKNAKKLLKATDISSEESEDHGLDSNS